jgi:hypothetical protein
MNSAGMFRKKIGYIKDIFVHIYKGRKEMVDGSLSGLTERLSSEGLYRVSASAYETHYAVYEVFACINSSEIASKLGKVEGNFSKVEGNFSKVEGNFDKVEGNFGKVEGNFGEVEGNFGKVEGNFGKVEGNFGKVEGNFGKVDVYFLAMGGSEKWGGDNENFWDKRNRQRGDSPLLFCFPFKKSVRYTKININQSLTKIECLWERIENKIDNHLKWFLVSGTAKKPKKLIYLLLNIKKGIHYAEC